MTKGALLHCDAITHWKNQIAHNNRVRQLKEFHERTLDNEMSQRLSEEEKNDAFLLGKKKSRNRDFANDLRQQLSSKLANGKAQNYPVVIREQNDGNDSESTDERNYQSELRRQREEEAGQNYLDDLERNRKHEQEVAEREQFLQDIRKAAVQNKENFVKKVKQFERDQQR